MCVSVGCRYFLYVVKHIFMLFMFGAMRCQYYVWIMCGICVACVFYNCVFVLVVVV